MHISEGVLGAPVLATGAIFTIMGLGLGLRKTHYDRLPEVALLASVFFIGSLIHVPLGPSAAHLVLTGLCGLLLGWAAFPAILVGLALQALLFQFGGLTTLGINTVNMAFPAVVVYYACGPLVRSSRSAWRMLGEFTAGAGAVLLSGIMVAASLMVSGESFAVAARLIVLAHVPVMVIEGIIAVFVVEFLRKVRPEMLTGRELRLRNSVLGNDDVAAC